GRITYDHMVAFWPTSFAAENFPVVAERMNNMPKIVFSRTMKAASWKNTAVVGGDIVDAVGKLKEEQGPDMAILGSGSIVSQLTSAGLIDEYQIVIAPIVLGKGRTMFEGITSPRRMRLTQTRAFENGKVVLYYEPITVAELMN
ncbi:MAG: dihydrofolate reductase family protein, partial [Candidatus Baltobacteraceae bacterium]